MFKNQLAVMKQTDQFFPCHYERFPLTLVEGRGCLVKDMKGKEYLDLLAGYAAINFGHGNQKLLNAFINQFRRIGLITSNFYNDMVGEFAEKLSCFAGLPEAQVLLMNSGAEAVEKAIKLCRRWGYFIKGIPLDQAEIIVSDSNFHGRTYGVLSASPTAKYRHGFGPFMPGFKFTKFGDVNDLSQIITDHTAAFLVEPIQGEGGFIFPPDNYLKRMEEICRANHILFVLDEIPTAFGRIGSFFPHFHYGVSPDMIILGKALGGGIYPVSAVVARKDIMAVLGPGDDGSTFGGNPLAAAVGLAAISLTEEDSLSEKVKVLGNYFIKELKNIKTEMIKEVRGLGLFIGVELNEPFEAKEICRQLMQNRIITASARQNVVRFTPPLTILKSEIESALDRIDSIFRTKIKV